ncbi:hypothetical protein M885DRAFT_550002 [Pelagophyceae sp. CCMP2097]|nr:hypothetical protein M885DRAFT_550002 [Pelagophyceae sp. CCMP2097]
MALALLSKTASDFQDWRRSEHASPGARFAFEALEGDEAARAGPDRRACPDEAAAARTELARQSARLAGALFRADVLARLSAAPPSSAAPPAAPPAAPGDACGVSRDGSAEVRAARRGLRAAARLLHAAEDDCLAAQRALLTRSDALGRAIVECEHIVFSTGADAAGEGAAADRARARRRREQELRATLASLDDELVAAAAAAPAAPADGAACDGRRRVAEATDGAAAAAASEKRALDLRVGALGGATVRAVEAATGGAGGVEVACAIDGAELAVVLAPTPGGGTRLAHAHLAHATVSVADVAAARAGVGRDAGAPADAVRAVVREAKARLRQLRGRQALVAALDAEPDVAAVPLDPNFERVAVRRPAPEKRLRPKSGNTRKGLWGAAARRLGDRCGSRARPRTSRARSASRNDSFDARRPATPPHRERRARTDAACRHDWPDCVAAPTVVSIQAYELVAIDKTLA